MNNAHSCQYCQQLVLRPEHLHAKDDEARLYGNIVDFPISITAITKACEENCPLFSTFTSMTSPVPIWPATSTLKGIIMFPDSVFHDDCDLELSVEIPGKGLLISKWQMVVEKCCSPAAEWIAKRPVNPFPDTPRTYELAKSWINDCLMTHDHGNTKVADFMPTRLIHASRHGSEFHIQLVHSAQITGTAEYCCLSYCWGGDQPQKLTKKCMEEGGRLNYHSLPATIQDAVRATVNLGYEYLWVDSMCIIQDDENDKRKEIPQMCGIYSNSVITIAAATTNSVFGGFLGTRTTRDIVARLPFQHPDGTTAFIGLYPYIADMSARDHAASPLDDRGWVLQERLLPTRTLEFRREQLRFSCPFVGDRLGYRDGGQDGSLYHSDEVLSNMKTLPSSFANANVLFQKWADIVEAYTHRKLTVPEDRTNAISGIAARVGSMLAHDDKYIAGHWMSRLVPSLMWSSSRGNQTSRLPSQVPTWSWLSVDSATRYGALHESDRRIHLCELDWPVDVLRVHSELQDAIAPYGAFKSAVLTLRGLSKRIQPHHGRRSRDTYHFPDRIGRPCPEKIELKEDTAEAGKVLEDQHVPIDLLLMRQRVPSTARSSGDVYALGLILRRVDAGCDKGKYIRLGWWGFYWRNALEDNGLTSLTAQDDVDPRLQAVFEGLGFEKAVVELV